MKHRVSLRVLLVTALFVTQATAHARWMNPSNGRFQTMDGYEGDQEEPRSLQKYVYVWNDPVDRADPTGNFVDGISTTFAAAENLEMTARDAARVSAGRRLATSRLDAAMAQYITSTVIALGATAATVGVYELASVYGRSDLRKAVKIRIETLKQRNGGQFLYHYTDCEAALDILRLQRIFISPQAVDVRTGLVYPPGAYATDISPLERYSQRELSNMLYFNPVRAAGKDVSAVVVIRNERPKGFIWLTSHQYYRPQGDVFALDVIPNPMRP
jgi:hypothetical protein